jgi:hypothetical protein
MYILVVNFKHPYIPSPNYSPYKYSYIPTMTADTATPLRIQVDFSPSSTTTTTTTATIAQSAPAQPNKSDEALLLTKDSLHLLPCRIKYSGPAKIDQYFLVEKEGEKDDGALPRPLI